MKKAKRTEVEKEAEEFYRTAPIDDKERQAFKEAFAKVLRRDEQVEQK